MNEETTNQSNGISLHENATELITNKAKHQDIRETASLEDGHEIVELDHPVNCGSSDPDSLRSRVGNMKLIHGDDHVTVSELVHERIMPHTYCSLLSNDMSASLPNLFGDQMLSGKDTVGNNALPSSKGSLSDVSTNDKLRYKTMSLEDCQQKGSRSNGSVFLMEELDNNKLSSVLERISLVYLPQTKQLVSRKSSDLPEPASGNQESGTDHLVGLPTRECPEGAEATSSNGTNTVVPQQSSQQMDDLNFTYQDPKIPTLELPDSLQDGTSENVVILSQESDVSVQSQSTVINCHHQGLDFVDLKRGNPCSAQDTRRLCDGEVLEDIDLSLEESLPGGLQKLNVTDPRDSAVSDLGRPTSLSRTDASSFSSISSLSTGTEHSVSYSDVDATEKPIVDTDEAGFVDINLDARSVNDQNFLSRTNSQDSGIVEANAHLGNLNHTHGAKPKKKGLSFLTRSLFSRKVKESPSEGTPLGWRLFGKVPPKEPSQESVTTATASVAPSAGEPPAPALSCDTVDLRCKDESKPETVNSSRQPSSSKVKRTDVEAPSTTALILENRPQGLPSKDPEEELRHRQQYEAMVEAAKKKELREAKLRKKQLQQQLKHEDALSAAVKTWNTDILPNWDNMRLSKKARDLWWNGIPPSVRGKVWKLAIGNDLNLTSELYEICLSRAKDRLKIMREAGSDTDSVSSFSMFADLPSSKEASVELIKLDVSRTFPQLCIFQKRGPYHELLQGLLGAYACYRPDVGYVQGMSFIAAVLLLNMDVDDAFICFANLLNRPCQIAFFRLDESLMNSYFETYEAFFMENLPKLFNYFKKQNVTPNLYIIDWLFTLYAKSLPLDVASRVWDVFCRDGEEFLFRTALGILKLHEEILLNMDFIHLAQFLTRLPENISSDQLFSCIDTVHMSIDKRRFCQVLADAQEQNRPSAATADS